MPNMSTQEKERSAATAKNREERAEKRNKYPVGLGVAVIAGKANRRQNGGASGASGVGEVLTRSRGATPAKVAKLPNAPLFSTQTACSNLTLV
jgi:hypothetical protein